MDEGYNMNSHLRNTNSRLMCKKGLSPSPSAYENAHSQGFCGQWGSGDGLGFTTWVLGLQKRWHLETVSGE